ncbi:biotin--[acetyl-CoA-carboxylase] ligase [Kordiimonas laminariae]|uniref:biotin--[acetyl-CoA-carboxylase] ligase n=1 Tax=Kordiimonas laminariae TaxID=2917717 RepID=UPI001FF3A14F|nr:biotin--[acetyl-CoA-carboxylase] ligase [Kordiimonas laminariae]MCK0071000.1 biotin--[acetyl-CoA-carboxylase] ligase [Kordiimonas laminariae]
MPHGVGARFFNSLDSTNIKATELATTGDKGPVWLVAGTQDAGRGRQGRVWTSKPGNLYTSLLFAPHIKPVDAGALPFITALVVRETFVGLGLENEQVQCKWPNDILINHKKASGILIESSAGSNGYLDHVIIGIGMNLLHSPTDAAFKATSFFEETKKTVEVRDALQLLAHNMKKRLDSWIVGQFESIGREWTENAWGLGEKREIRTTRDTFEGTLLGLDSHGGLKISVPTGEEQTIYAADIFPSLSGN